MGYGRLHCITPSSLVHWGVWANPVYIETVRVTLTQMEQTVIGNR